MDESLKSFIGVKWSIALSPQLSFWTKQYTHCIRRKYPTNFLLLFFSNTLIFYEEVHIFMVIFLPIENFHFLPDFSRQKINCCWDLEMTFAGRGVFFLSVPASFGDLSTMVYIRIEYRKKTLINLSDASVVVASSWNKWSSGRCSGLSFRSEFSFQRYRDFPSNPHHASVLHSWLVRLICLSVCLSVIISLKGREDTPRSTCLHTE